jgi:hypothetical protein
LPTPDTARYAKEAEALAEIHSDAIQLKSDTIKGSPQEPMSEDELIAKFRGCLEFGLNASRADADKLADAIMNIDKATVAAAVIVGAFPQSK